MAPRKKGTGETAAATRSTRKASAERTKRPRCKTCGKTIPVPQGWSRGASVRRHYWRKHPEVMRPGGDR